MDTDLSIKYGQVKRIINKEIYIKYTYIGKKEILAFDAVLIQNIY